MNFHNSKGVKTSILPTEKKEVKATFSESPIFNSKQKNKKWEININFSWKNMGQGCPKHDKSFILCWELLSGSKMALVV